MLHIELNVKYLSMPCFRQLVIYIGDEHISTLKFMVLLNRIFVAGRYFYRTLLAYPNDITRAQELFPQPFKDETLLCQSVPRSKHSPLRLYRVSHSDLRLAQVSAPS
jgi:hypothetical protein